MSLHNDIMKAFQGLSPDELAESLDSLQRNADIISGKLPKPSPDECDHSLRQGDNYGETCQLCGSQLAGYGHWGEFDECIHLYDGGYCIYCEMPEK